MNLDDALRAAFDIETAGVPERRPSAAEVSRACAVPGAGGGRSRMPGCFVPVLALAAASVVALCLNPVSVRFMRPFAIELAESLPDEAASGFADFVLEAGASYRSSEDRL